MVSDMLSQSEIDALLRQNSIEEEQDNSLSESIDDYVSAIEQDALGEIGNITFGTASTAFSTLLNQKVDITTPTLSIIKKTDLKDHFPKPHVAINVRYTEGFEGTNLLIIKVEDAKIIADLMLGGDGNAPDEELNEMHLSAVQEAMNQMMGSASTSMSTIFNRRIDISPPGIDVHDFAEFAGDPLPPETEQVLIMVSFRMKIGTLIDSHIMQLLPVPFAKHMVQLLLNPDVAEPETKVQESQPVKQTQNESVAPPQQAQHYQEPEVAYHQPHSPQRSEYVQPAIQQRTANVQPVQFSNFEETPALQADTRNLDLLLDIPLQVTVELGRTKRVIKDILELSPGSIVELDKLAGEPVDILVNNKLIAKGEVVVIEENFGVRVTDILSPRDRLQKLQ